jgi:hypothetical protein
MTSSGMSQRAKSPTKMPQAQAIAPSARLQQCALDAVALSPLAQTALSLTGDQHHYLGFGRKHRIHLLSRYVDGSASLESASSMWTGSGPC